MAKSWMLDRREVLETMRQSNSLHEAYMSLAKLPAADVRENVIRTQADKIRAMSDEELADKLWSIAHYEQKKRCISDWLDWLKAEVEDG